jgi:hypothetical protein
MTMPFRHPRCVHVAGGRPTIAVLNMGPRHGRDGYTVALCRECADHCVGALQGLLDYDDGHRVERTRFEATGDATECKKGPP